MKKVTMRDIGVAAGVSTVTVSKALGGKPGMSEEMRRRIMNIAKEMGYQHPDANTLKLKSNLDIGILIPEAYFQTNSFYSVLYKKLITRLGAEGHFGLLELLTEKDEAALRPPHLIDTRHVDGLILLGQPSKEYFRTISGEGVPIVFLDFYDEHGSADAVVGDNTYGCYRLTSHLIKNGHRKIGFVGNARATSSIMDRYLGYYRAMLVNDLPIRSDWLLSDRDSRNNLIPLELPEELPTAFVCNCDLVASRLIEKLRERGVRVPEDVSVTGFDDFTDAAPTDVPLSTFRVDTDGMIELALKAITERCSGSRKPFGRMVVSGQPVYRQSEKALE
ncbi:MAG: LacI family DNA-binding transcriptional regulator [Clostridiales bacterium]|nr:LacI family DNA-binding transcriptional regulator [Clostridia bacterium]MCR4884507.1 LacI family DNA-binding transcriptional regulator [Clostridiales bacterium]